MAIKPGIGRTTLIYLMTKQYNKVADNLVNINDMFETREQAIHLMKQRTQRIAEKAGA